MHFFARKCFQVFLVLMRITIDTNMPQESEAFFNCYTRSERNQALTLRSQVVLSSRLEGLRSRCSTLAEWIYLAL